MEQTPLPPLVSDDWIAENNGYAWSLADMRDIYEADRAKTREVVQALEDVDKEVAMLKEMEDFAVRRGSTRGILVHEDFNALGYQRKHKEWSVLKRKRNELLTRLK